MSARVLIVVTHLLGTGHLARALSLGRAFAAAGHDAHVATGGMPAPHLDASAVTLHQLPPLRSDGIDFSRLLTETGEVAGADYRHQRMEMLLDLLTGIRPDILITELFPFGRRNLRDEFFALLEAAHAMPRRPRIFASIRDILAPPSKPAKAAFAEEMVERFCDGVLVHSDPSLVPLDLSWPVTPDLGKCLSYTGFVTSPLPAREASAGHGEILVSAGGGMVGDTLFTAALNAARNSPYRWRLLIGGGQAQDHIAALRQSATPNVTVEGTRPDFRAMLQVARASISLCGYNTAMDVLQTGIPAVFTPFDDGAEVEQGLRANALRHMDGIEVVSSQALSGKALSTALEQALAAPPRDATSINFYGAAETVRICLKALQ